MAGDARSPHLVAESSVLVLLRDNRRRLQVMEYEPVLSGERAEGWLSVQELIRASLPFTSSSVCGLTLSESSGKLAVGLGLGDHGRLGVTFLWYAALVLHPADIVVKGASG